MKNLFNENGFGYRIENDSITIIDYNHDSKNIIIPEKINGLPVKTIGNGAFYDNELTSVIIPDSVKTIDDDAFAYNKLTSVIIPDSVKTIDDYAFADNQLTNVVIPNSVKTIGENAFDKSVKIIRE